MGRCITKNVFWIGYIYGIYKFIYYCYLYKICVRLGLLIFYFWMSEGVYEIVFFLEGLLVINICLGNSVIVFREIVVILWSNFLFTFIYVSLIKFCGLSIKKVGKEEGVGWEEGYWWEREENRGVKVIIIYYIIYINR